MTVRLVATPERPAGGAVLDALNQLDNQCFPGHEPYPKSDGYWWLVREGDKPVAFAGLTVKDDGESGYLCRVGVIQACRGRGLQKRLIRLRERMARKLGLHQLVTYTTRTSLISANNLIDCGFRLYSPPFLWGDTDWLYFRKPLGGLKGT